jgi:hypothetical protein
MDSPVVDQGAAGPVDEVPEGIDPPYPQLGDLARRAAHRILVTLPAGLGVVDRAQSCVDFLDLAEFLLVEIELRLGGEAVGHVVEPGWGFHDDAVHQRWRQKHENEPCEDRQTPGRHFSLPCPHDPVLQQT